ncbi:hypothetical protein O5759_27045, partial [Escherichia coli]|nr:hypothetical protein [Escherichia coli]
MPTAPMTGGFAYVLDESGDFRKRVNPELVDHVNEQVREYIRNAERPESQGETPAHKRQEHGGFTLRIKLS